MGAQLKAVLVGCGAISRAWLEPIGAMPELELVGLVDLNEQAARARAAEFGLGRALVGADLERVLAQTSPDIVFDCTVPAAHHQVALAALARGCHVLAEKPMADSLEHARAILAASQAAGRLHAVMQNRRYDPNIRRLRGLVESGALGPLTTLHSDFFIGAHFGGFRDHMPHVLLLDMAIHTFDAARLISGADPRSVYCKEWNPPGSWYAHGASAVAVFELGGGLVYTYRGSWCAEGLSTTWEAHWRAIGTRGSALWDGAQHLEAQAVAEPGGFRWPTRPVEPPPAADTGPGGHAGAIRAFVRCLQDGTPPETSGADNIKSLAMVFAAIASAEAGAPVPVTW